MDNQSISKHHQYADRGTGVGVMGLNKRENDFGTRSLNKQVCILIGQTAGEVNALFAQESTHAFCQHDLVFHSYCYRSDLLVQNIYLLDKVQVY